MATAPQTLNYLGWLLSQSLLGGWGLVLLGAAVGSVLFATRRLRRARWALGLAIIPLVLPVIAAVGWATATNVNRTAAWVGYGVLVGIGGWLVLALGTIIGSRGVRAPLIVAALLSAVPMLSGAAVAAMSGSGDWI